ncbi:MAG TPA: Rieske 2Fe-2S domain-containing protein, partial [Sphingobium sp.]|nr:Rieske 2Fe-2S domain-containing protein [Sphingobium sp.]
MANMTSDTVRAAGEAGLSSRATSAAGEAAARHSLAGHAALVQDERVHSSIYTDPAIFADEMANIFERCWIFVGHDSEIPNPGDFRTRKIGKQPVLFVRGRDGVARVLMNRCTHRGVQLCIEDRGNASR